MRILLDCRPLLTEGFDTERSRVILALAAALSREQGVSWILLFDQNYRSEQWPVWSGASVVIHRSLPGVLGWRLWYDRTIPRLAKKQGAHLVMLTGGVAAVSGKIRQCVWMPEKARPVKGKAGWPLYKRRLSDSIEAASLLFCFSETDRDWLADQAAGKDAEKFRVVAAWPSEALRPFSADEKEAIKQEHSGGKEYFLADVSTAGEEGILWLLKAFSLFKKRQRSNLQLVLAGRQPSPESKLSGRLETYKYRQDIHWCAPAEAGKRLFGGAYALLFPFEKRGLGISVLDAWKAEVPVITGKDAGLPEWTGDGVLVAGAGDADSLAGHLKTMYKDEQLRGELIGKGRSGVAAFNLQRSLEIVWEGLNRVVPQPISG